jgi:magnesium transporter
LSIECRWMTQLDYFVNPLLEQLSPVKPQATLQLLGYQADTSGQIMALELISLKENFTVFHSSPSSLPTQNCQVRAGRGAGEQRSRGEVNTKLFPLRTSAPLLTTMQSLCGAPLERIRNLVNASEMIYYLYVTDVERYLTGILSLWELLTSQPEQVIGEIMTRDVVFVYSDTEQEEVARLIQRYDFLVVPV